MSSLSESKKKEKLGSGKHKELSSNQLNHIVTVIENWKQDEEGLQVYYYTLRKHSHGIGSFKNKEMFIFIFFFVFYDFCSKHRLWVHVRFFYEQTW